MQEEYSKIEETEEKHEPSEEAETIEAKSEDIARGAILDMAKTWEENGDVYQAIITYKDLIKTAPESPEAKEAKEGLLRIAQFYQKEGATHSALSIYSYMAKMSA